MLLLVVALNRGGKGEGGGGGVHNGLFQGQYSNHSDLVVNGELFNRLKKN